MKKNSIFRLVLLAAATFSLHSCRTEDELIQTPQETVNRFQVFTSRNGEPVNYPRGYKILLERYDSIYSSAYTKKAFLKNNILGKSVSEEYVELTIRSQELMMKDGNERWILYPVAKGKEVIGIEAGILKNKESELEFWRMDTQGAYYKEIIDLFRLAYSKKILSDQAMSKGGNCGFIGEEPCDTGEVIIHVPHPNGPKGDPNLYLPGQGGGGSDPGVIGGDCGVYGNCGDGSSGENPNDTNDDPCKKMKDIVKNLKSKPALDDLKTKSTQGGENGYKFKADGTPSNLIIGSEHSVNFGDKTGYAGGYHNHTPKGIPMLSVPDIDQLLGFARAQGNYGNPSNAYMGMIAPNGMHYVIWFNGNYQDALTNFSQDDLDAFARDYQTRYGINKPSTGNMSNDAIERFFFKALRDMGLDGKVNLQRIENDGTVKTIMKNIDGTTTATPCP